MLYLRTLRNMLVEILPSICKLNFKPPPIKGFGDITQGTHVFCSFESKKCESKADFTSVWRLLDNKWVVTRALRYGHRDN